MKSSKLILLTILIIACLLITSQCQRGGSRGRSRSGSSSRSSSSRSSGTRHHHHYWGSSSSGKKENCTTVNGTTTCTYTEKELTTTDIVIFAVVVVVAVIGVIAKGQGSNRSSSIFKTDDQPKTFDVVKDVMDNFEMRMQQWPSTLMPQVRQSMLDAFMSRRYTMVINVRDNDEKFFCQLRVADLFKETDYKYRIKMTGSDSVGTSKIEGLLLFTGPGMGFKLSKVYDDRRKAEQTGSFRDLFFEGGGNPDGFSGDWAFYGYQNSMEYSGQWVMNTF